MASTSSRQKRESPITGLLDKQGPQMPATCGQHKPTLSDGARVQLS